MFNKYLLNICPVSDLLLNLYCYITNIMDSLLDKIVTNYYCYTRANRYTSCKLI